MVFGKIFGSSFPGSTAPTTFPTTPRIKIDKKGDIKIITGPIDFEDVIDTVDTVRRLSKSISNILDELKEERTLTKGDVIGVSRGIYEHYGVYIGNDKVIHYTSPDSDVSFSENRIMETGMEHFIRDANEFFILDCTYKNSAIKSKPIKTAFAPTNGDIFDLFKKMERQSVYSPEETVKRAKLRLGETKYNLVVNNCEHFAIWCKTGISKSHQVEAYLGMISRKKVWNI